MADISCLPSDLIPDARCIETCIPPGMQMPVLIALFCRIAGGAGPAPNPPPAPFISGTYVLDINNDQELDSITVTSAVPGGNVGGTYQLWGDVSGLLDSRPVSQPNPVFTSSPAWSGENNVWIIEVGNGTSFVGSSPASNVIPTIIAGPPPAFQDIGIDWTTSGPSLPAQTGLFAWVNATGLLGITSLTIRDTTNDQGFDFEFCNDLVTLSFPNITTITGGYFYVYGCPNLTSITMPVFASQSTGLASFAIDTCVALTTLTLTLLASTTGGFFVANCSALGTLALPALTTVGGDFTISGNTTLSAISVPTLTSLGGFIDVHGCDAITTLNLSGVPAAVFVDASICGLLGTVNLSSLTTVSGNMDFTGCGNLSSLNLSALVTVAGSVSFTSVFSLGTLTLNSLADVGDFSADASGIATVNMTSGVNFHGGIIFNNSNLVTFNCPGCTFTNGTMVLFQNCQLNQTSVDLILARLVASGVTTCYIDLSGGGNSAPSPAGNANKITLLTNGNTVFTN